MTNGEIVDHLSLIVIDANNRCWKPCLLYVTLAVDTTYLDGVMLVCDPCNGHIAPRSIYVDDGSHGGHGLDVFGVGVALLILNGAHTLGGALDGFVDDVEMAHTLGWNPYC